MKLLTDQLIDRSIDQCDIERIEGIEWNDNIKEINSIERLMVLERSTVLKFDIILNVVIPQGINIELL